MTPPRDTTMVVGAGTCAGQVAAELAAAGNTRLLIVTDSDNNGVKKWLKSTDTTTIELLANTKIVACHQTESNNRISLDLINLDLTSGNRSFSRTVDKIVVAQPQRREVNFALNHLQPSSQVVPLSEITRPSEVIPTEWMNPDGATRVVFLTGLFAESHPTIAAEVMQAALRVQTHNDKNKKAIQTYILTNNLKVAGDGLEALYRETKQAGTVYIKFTETVPDIRQKDGGVCMTFTDEVTGLPFMLTPNITVVDETILPPENMDELAALLGLEMDADGFSQADNVHRQTVFTNRHGILVAGSSRSIQGPADQMIDADNVALTVSTLGSGETHRLEGKATIDQGACVRCLTCYRLCPYRAIFLSAYPTVNPVACEQCGICAAECPQHAIGIQGLGREEIITHIGPSTAVHNDDVFTPFIIAFCCGRSGIPAAELAGLMGRALPIGLKIVEVPCSGGLSAEHIFSGCQMGADGILVLTCHEGNCHSTQGNIHARNRVEQLKSRLTVLGYDPKRLEIQTLASNMGAEFAALTQQFADKVIECGPSPLSHRSD